MAINIYIGNLHYSLDEEDIREIFSDYPSLKTVKIIRDKETNRSKGFGFLYFSDRFDGEHALNTMNEKEISGRRLKLSMATRQDPQDENNEKRHFSPRFFSDQLRKQKVDQE